VRSINKGNKCVNKGVRDHNYSYFTGEYTYVAFPVTTVIHSSIQGYTSVKSKKMQLLVFQGWLVCTHITLSLPPTVVVVEIQCRIELLKNISFDRANMLTFTSRPQSA